MNGSGAKQKSKKKRREGRENKGAPSQGCRTLYFQPSADSERTAEGDSRAPGASEAGDRHSEKTENNSAEANILHARLLCQMVKSLE